MKREKYFDVAKGIGMLCIIAGHLDIHQIVKLVYPFHVPLFFIISGYFLNENKDVKKVLWKKCKNLFIPYILTIFMEIILSSIYILLRTQDGTTGIQNMARNKIISGIYASGMKNPLLKGVESVGAIWFLPTLFVSVMIVLLLIHFKYSFVYIITLFFTGILISKIVWLPFGIAVGMCGSLFVFAGWYLKKTSILQNPYLWILSLIVYLIEISLNLFVIVASNHYPHYITSFNAILISLGVIILAKYIEYIRYISDFLSFFGRNSLIVLCVHTIELRYFPWEKSNMPSLIIYVCKIILISIIRLRRQKYL